MSHSEVMKWFEYYFPDYAGERIDVFFKLYDSFRWGGRDGY